MPPAGSTLPKANLSESSLTWPLNVGAVYRLM